MAEPRLIESSELPLERELLRAASAELAPLAVRRRALGALGLLRIMPPAASVSVPPAPHSRTRRFSRWFAKVSLVVAIGAAVGVAVATAARTQLDSHAEPANPAQSEPANSDTLR